MEDKSGPPPAYNDTQGQAQYPQQQQPGGYPQQPMQYAPPQGQYPALPPGQPGQYPPGQPGQYPPGQPGQYQPPPPGQGPYPGGPAPGVYPPPGQPCPQVGYVAAPTQVVYVNPQGTIINPPADHLAYAIIVTLFCCCPIGVLAIVKSTQVKDAIRRNDEATARQLSNETLRYCKISLIVGIVLNILSICLIAVYYAVMIPMVLNANSNSYGNNK